MSKSVDRENRDVGEIGMAHDQRCITPPVGILAVVFLALVGLLIPNSARAGVAFDTSAGSTFGFATNAGANCPAPNITPTASVFTCSDAAGDSQSAFAAAAPGILRASAFVTAIPCPSSSDCAANVRANADFEDPNGLIFNSNIVGQTNINISGILVKFSAGVGADPNGFASALGRASVNGQQLTICLNDTIGDAGCGDFMVTVPVNTPLTLTLLLDVFAGAQAGFESQSKFSFADASHTFGFVPGGEVFDLPPGVTANDPDLFIFNNVFLPPDTTAVPEPSSAVMLMIGLTGLGVLRRRASRPRVHTAGA